MGFFGKWRMPTSRSSSRNPSNSRPKRPMQSRAPRPSNLPNRNLLSSLCRSRAALSSSNVRIAENGLRHEAMSGRYIPGREDCERVPPRVRSGELLLHPTMANRRNSKMENVPARQRGIYFYARYRSVFKASRLGWLPESVHRLYQTLQGAASLPRWCAFQRGTARRLPQG